jgi:uncharacterized protein (TIGR02186 family)
MTTGGSLLRSGPSPRAAAAAVGLALLAAGGAAGAARAASFVADLSDHLIAITTAFTGTDVLLFGAVDQPGSKVVVVVRGPAGEAAVRRKERAGPVWVFAAEVDFQNAPSYYAVAASAPLAEVALQSELERHQIGVANLRLEPAPGQEVDRAELAAFRAAFVRSKQQAGLYPEQVGAVGFLGGTLFRTRLSFPAQVTPGAYEVQVFQFVDGRVANAQTSVLDIAKVGLEAELSDFARRQPVLYALASVLVALLAGWTAALAFRRA